MALTGDRIMMTFMDETASIAPGTIIPVAGGGKVSYWPSHFNSSVSTTSNTTYYWNEDNLEPREPERWLDWVLGTVRSRAWK